MSGDEVFKVGSCRCGDIRIEVTGSPVLVEFCHCRSCRHTVGAPLMAWAGYKKESIQYVLGRPTSYQSSPGVERTFCGRCGTSLTLMDQRFPNEAYIALSCFDDGDAPAPDIHIWRSERLPWVETTDELPRFRQFQNDGLIE